MEPTIALNDTAPDYSSLMMQRSWQDAKHFHYDQTYGDNKPYVWHLSHVSTLCIMPIYVDEFKKTQTWRHAEFIWRVPAAFLTVVANLHDILEDTEMSYEMLAERYPVEICRIVESVTDAPGKNRKERKLNTWHKIRRYDGAVYLKLCDRLANTLEAEKREMYRKEFPAFQAALYLPGQFPILWNALEQATYG